MAHALSTRVITHYASIEKEDKKIPLTRDDAEALRDTLKAVTTTKYITIPNPDDPLGEPLWEGRAGNVLIIKNDGGNTSGMRFICEYGTRHPVHESCTCEKKYWVYPWTVREESMRLFKEFPNELKAPDLEKLIERIPLLKKARYF